MTYEMNSGGMKELLFAAGAAIEQNEAYLNALDAAIGDGDHGITMRRGFQAILIATRDLPAESCPAEFLKLGGQSFTQSTGGAIGIILGRALIEAGDAVWNKSVLRPEDWKQCFLAMESAVSSVGKAKPWDKTMLDALHSINNRLESVDANTDFSNLFSAAAAAAEHAVELTAPMSCRVGRASRLGDRAVGHPDPGTASFAIIIRAMSNRIADLSATSIEMTE
jgi:dihydroxyacetone kinase-like protein